MRPTCKHCGLKHRSENCNRPEGLAARGGKKVKIDHHSMDWPYQPPAAKKSRTAREGKCDRNPQAGH
jgi:hypothetical protein